MEKKLSSLDTLSLSRDAGYMDYYVLCVCNSGATTLPQSLQAWFSSARPKCKKILSIQSVKFVLKWSHIIQRSAFTHGRTCRKI